MDSNTDYLIQSLDAIKVTYGIDPSTDRRGGWSQTTRWLVNHGKGSRLGGRVDPWDDVRMNGSHRPVQPVRIGGSRSTNFVELVVTGYQFPDIPDGSDADWLVGTLRGAGGPYRGGERFTIETQELEDLRTEFARLYKELGGGFEFEPIEPHVSLKVNGDGLGHFRVRCQLNAEPLLVGPALSYEISLDQTEIPSIVAALDALVALFPRRSRPLR